MRRQRPGRPGRLTRSSGAVGGGGGGVSDLETAVLALSPVGYWILDEASGNAIDSISANNGTWSATPTYEALAGADGRSYPDWPASGGVDIPNSTDYDSDAGLSVMAVVYPEASGLWTIANKPDAWEFYSNSGTDLLVQMHPSARRSTTASSVVTRQAWNLVVFTVPADLNAYPKVYCNSNVDQTDTLVNSVARQDSTDGITLGYYSGVGVIQLDATMGHFAVFDKELSESEIGGLVSAFEAQGWV